MRKVIPSHVHIEAGNAMLAALKKYEPELSPADMLALAANLVGKLIALQDQSKVTPEMAMEMVLANIRNGNHEAVKQLSHTVGNA